MPSFARGRGVASGFVANREAARSTAAFPSSIRGGGSHAAKIGLH
jgi:hypothetical protein